MSNRTIACILATAVILGLLFQFAPHFFGYIVLSQIAQSHIDGNVPKGKLFDEYLKRDLAKHFCRNAADCSVTYELLRDGPTQSGVAYPKYYAWVKVLRGKQVQQEGAVRLAAMDQKEFDIREFVSREEILKTPSALVTVFPAALVDRIRQKANSR